MHLRRFFCDQSTCRRRTFAEQLPGGVEPYARRTVQLTQALTVPGFALGGEAGARLARRLAGVKSSISPDTLLRLIRQQMPAAAPTPRVLGVDDFAFHRGIHCGTILVDLERPRVVDLLPDREARIFAAWLRAHPGIAVISRDRSSAYSEATQQAAPGAMQVAIRFHVWGWRWTGCLPASTASSLRLLAKSTKLKSDKSRPRARLNPPHSHARRPRVTSGGQIQPKRAAKHDIPRSTISSSAATRFGPLLDWLGSPAPLSDGTCARSGGAVEQAVRGRRWHACDPFAPYLRTRWEAGEHNSAVLLAELRPQGFTGCYPPYDNISWPGALGHIALVADRPMRMAYPLLCRAHKNL